MKKFLIRVIFIFVCASFTHAMAGTYDDFFRAVRNDDVNSAKELIQRGIDPNWPDEKGVPALVLALQLDMQRMPLFLAQLPQINVEQQNPAGETPLMLAALRNRFDVVRVLVDRGAEINKPGWTPLHYAATHGNLEIMHFLLDHEAYIDADAPNGNTPLMMAAQFAPPIATKVLLEEGADPTLRNNLQRSALDLAVMEGHEPVAFYLRAFAQAWKTNEQKRALIQRD